jgi:predicted metal-dependent phosphoesterase TrpH
MNSIKLDLHLHTIYSRDSLIKPKEALKFAKKKGLDGFAITDHNTLKAYRILTEENNTDLIIVPGMEIETNIGEIIALFLQEEIKTKDNNFFTILDLIKDQDGLIIIPDPFDFLRSNRLKMELLTDVVIHKYIDGIEILNSRITFKKSIKKAKSFNRRYNLFETGGSDAHSNREIGKAYTEIDDVEEKTFENIKKSLMENKSRSLGKLSSPLVHLKTMTHKITKRSYF